MQMVQSFKEAERFSSIRKACNAVAEWSKDRAVAELKFNIQTDERGDWFVKVDHGAAVFGWLSGEFALTLYRERNPCGGRLN